jgi:hypothetical protein
VNNTPISRANFFGALTQRVYATQVPKGGLVKATSSLPQTVNAFTAANLKEVELGDN